MLMKNNAGSYKVRKKCIFLDGGDQKYQNLSSKNTLFRKFSEKC